MWLIENWEVARGQRGLGRNRVKNKLKNGRMISGTVWKYRQKRRLFKVNVIKEMAKCLMKWLRGTHSSLKSIKYGKKTIERDIHAVSVPRDHVRVSHNGSSKIFYKYKGILPLVSGDMASCLSFFAFDSYWVIGCGVCKLELSLTLIF